MEKTKHSQKEMIGWKKTNTALNDFICGARFGELFFERLDAFVHLVQLVLRYGLVALIREINLALAKHLALDEPLGGETVEHLLHPRARNGGVQIVKQLQDAVRSILLPCIEHTGGGRNNINSSSACWPRFDSSATISASQYPIEIVQQDFFGVAFGCHHDRGGRLAAGRSRGCRCRRAFGGRCGGRC
jgi:hypothetical protein